MSDIDFITIIDCLDINNVITGNAKIVKAAELESSINSIKQTFNKEYLYKDIFQMAAHLIYSLAESHCFENGNKRTAILVGILFLNKNRVWLNPAKQIDLANLVIDLLKGDKNIEQLEKFLAEQEIHI